MNITISHRPTEFSKDLDFVHALRQIKPLGQGCGKGITAGPDTLRRNGAQIPGQADGFAGAVGKLEEDRLGQEAVQDIGGDRRFLAGAWNPKGVTAGVIVPLHLHILVRPGPGRRQLFLWSRAFLADKPARSARYSFCPAAGFIMYMPTGYAF